MAHIGKLRPRLGSRLLQHLIRVQTAAGVAACRTVLGTEWAHSLARCLGTVPTAHANPVVGAQLSGGPSHAVLAPATSNRVCLLHQGDKGAIGMPGRVVSWCIFTCSVATACFSTLACPPNPDKMSPTPARGGGGGLGLPFPPLKSASARDRPGEGRTFSSNPSELAIRLYSPESCHGQGKIQEKGMNKALCQSPPGRTG